MPLKPNLVTSLRSLRLPRTDILTRIQERADALWVSASSDILKSAINRHQYDPDCQCGWCQKTKEYVRDRIFNTKFNRHLQIYGGNDDQWLTMVCGHEKEKALKSERREMKSL